VALIGHRVGQPPETARMAVNAAVTRRTRMSTIEISVFEIIRRLRTENEFPLNGSWDAFCGDFELARPLELAQDIS